MLDNKQIESNWNQIKSLVHSHWNKLSETEIEETHGDVDSLLKLLESKYGKSTKLESELEMICREYTKKTIRPKPSVYEWDFEDSDDEGMTSIDDHTADYSGLGFSEDEAIEVQPSPRREINLPIKPGTEEIGIEENNEKQTAPDEVKTNQDPQQVHEDITLGRSNSSANTTSPSALFSSEATKRL